MTLASHRSLAFLAFLVVGVWSSVLGGVTSAQEGAAPPQSEGFNYYVTGYYNFNFGGTLFQDRDGTATTGYGAALAFGARHIVSGEVDFNYSPQFFGPEPESSHNNVLTLTFSGIVGPWIKVATGQRVRPYACFGVGMIRSLIDTSVDISPQTDLVVDVGGGLLWFVAPRVGVRGDLRHRWDRGDLSQRGGYIATLNYFRASLGVAVAF